MSTSPSRSLRRATVASCAVLALMLSSGLIRAAAQGQGAAGPPAFPVVPLRANMSMIVGPTANVTAQFGDDGAVAIDSMTQADGESLVASIRSVSQRPIRYIINTSADDDHTGGNEVLSRAGRYFSRERFEMLFATPGAATIFAHENTLKWLSEAHGARPAAPSGRWPIETYFNERQEFFINGEGMQIIYVPSAHTSGDSMVFFRRSDVLSTGDVFTPDRYPAFDVEQGGSINGFVDGLNAILDVTLPGPNQEGGTLVVPGHGRLCDEADVADYRDMATIVRDRVQDLVGKKMTLAQVQAARPTRDYDVVYAQPSNTGEMFVERVYRSLTQGQKP